PGETFEYRFKAEPAGTYLWHSHTGVQYGEGMFGMLIVDALDDPYRGDYDVEQTVCINDWFHQPGTEILANLERGAYMKSADMDAGMGPGAKGSAGGGMGAGTQGSAGGGMGAGTQGSASGGSMGHGTMGSATPAATPAAPDLADVPFQSALING